MRTTVRIADELLDRAKVVAAREGTTLSAVVDEGLRLAVGRREAPALSNAEPLATFRGRGLQGGVDLDDTAAILDLMAEDAHA
ncbi:MAG: type II toxin-antitoxin system VapB family antitoxin [Candidatus Dormibacteria bacterium]